MAAWSHAHGRKVNALVSLSLKLPSQESKQKGAQKGAQQGTQQQQQQQQTGFCEFLCVADTSKQITLYLVQQR